MLALIQHFEAFSFQTNTREQNNYSQGIFANVLNVSIKTVQSWESGVRAPSHVALRLLEVVDKGFYRP